MRNRPVEFFICPLASTRIILAAILFPVFAQARDKARQASCLSNEKQIGLAFMQYTQDYDETYPVSWSNETGTFSKSWDAAVEPYMGMKVATYSGNPAVFKCPADASPTPSTTIWPTKPTLRSYASRALPVGSGKWFPNSW